MQKLLVKLQKKKEKNGGNEMKSTIKKVGYFYDVHFASPQRWGNKVVDYPRRETFESKRNAMKFAKLMNKEYKIEKKKLFHRR